MIHIYYIYNVSDLYEDDYVDEDMIEVYDENGELKVALYVLL